ncbi:MULTISPECIES: BON domain-containing protein [unclassified Burkholderia]|uniref:BON domain-containing protein n=1 Tax=unclassified Burkholderia TaxID=2613784 RepID=UPI000F5A277E|nr:MULTISPECIES: BON domain-containing protein [unclassified Burkholderia]RQS29891.1 BON domain-containing protein [Burkholderia sp. Bp8990]RQS52676.1 BON domain-containing protein [Burkholderia sp. Bp8984]RQZ25870.1 BON domain-containing protein [Burkholderia sp. Bp9090]
MKTITKTITTASAVLLTVVCIDGYAQSTGTGNPAFVAVATTASAAVQTASGVVSDRQLAASVRSALHGARRRGLRSSYIRVRAKGGVVTLTGVVADDSQIALSTSIVQGVPGVTSVVNKLKLRVVAGIKGTE